MFSQVVLLDISGDAAFRPPSDVNETAADVVIRMELPGVTSQEIDIRVQGSRIEVCGEKRPDTATDDASYICLERAFGRFHRAFDVSGAVNLAGMTASLRAGVLMLVIPKCTERRGLERRVPICEETDG
jgi:HSP20 family protein